MLWVFLPKVFLVVFILAALITAHRGQILDLIDIGYMSKTNDAFEFLLSEHLKQSRPGCSLLLKAVPEERRLSVFQHM